ncbi:MAG: 3,4-dihydroxy-2-butanone-4-phosphate synthase [Gammaproteobacteria bacterium]
MRLDSPGQLLDAFRQGGMAVLIDEDDERIGGVIMAPAATISAEQVNFMARNARGLVSLALTPERCEQLALPPMTGTAADAGTSRFRVSIEAAEGISTGISAADRAHTIRVAVARGAQPRDLVQPGHVFPLRAESGGVLKRAGHAEGGCDLARLAGHEPAAVLAEILDHEGSLATGASLQAFAQTHGLPIGSIAGLIQFRLLHEATVEPIREGEVQTAWGAFRLHAFRESGSGAIHVALCQGRIDAAVPVLVRVHVASALRDLAWTRMPGQGPNWNAARCLERIARDGNGVFVLLDQTEGREHLMASIGAALGSGERVAPTRSPQTTHTLVGVGSQILRRLGVGRMRLMGPPIRYNAISGFGLEVVEYLAYEAG